MTTPSDLPQPIIDLYDEYTHAPLDRRVFLKQLASLAGSSMPWATDKSVVNCAPGGRAATSLMAIEPSRRRNHSMCVRLVPTPRASKACGPAR